MDKLISPADYTLSERLAIMMHDGGCTEEEAREYLRIHGTGEDRGEQIKLEGI